MSYVTTVSLEFPCSHLEVYEALCDLGRYPLWNSGMISISETGIMYEGLQYETQSTVAGRINKAQVEVVRMIDGYEIELFSEAGLIAFKVLFLLQEVSATSTELTCALRFEFNKLVLHLARPAIEAMAHARVRGDLETLRAILAPATSNTPLNPQGA